MDEFSMGSELFFKFILPILPSRKLTFLCLFVFHEGVDLHLVLHTLEESSIRLRFHPMVL